MPSPPLPALLWRSFRVWHVFGANTDVGKTVWTTLLALTAAADASPAETVAFLKPVSTGPADEADARHIGRFATPVVRETLFHYPQPVSPHAAARLSGEPIPSDAALLARCRDFAARCACRGPGCLFLETAGGVHSPGPSGTTQADLYMPLRAPVVLVGGHRLGGISQTIAAFEALRLRGYDVESVLLFADARHDNHGFLADYLGPRYGVPVSALAQPPARSPDPGRDAEAMAEYYRRDECRGVARRVLKHLRRSHGEHVAALESLAPRAHRTIWYPFTQQGLLGPGDIVAIDSAYGDCFQTLAPAADTPDAPLLRASVDGSASWWTQGLGHGNPRLSLAAAHAAGRYGHVMFAGAVHEPAMALAEALLRGLANPRLARVFYSDNGSTGAEVAVKMALRAARLRYGWAARDRLRVLGLRGSYHGDTMGAMDCAEPCAYNAKVEWYEGKGHWLDYPTVLCSGGQWSVAVDSRFEEDLGAGKRYGSLREIFDVEAREARGEHRHYEAFISETLARLQRQGHRFGALMLEPVVLGAGGMQLVDPLFQRTLVNVVRRSPHLLGASPSQTPSTVPDDWTGLPVVFDEVFTGLYRLGRLSAASFLGVQPDISVHAKLLTGGLVPLCATLASEPIFDVFRSRDKTDALLHGHSYTAHPVGCQVALESLREMQAMEQRGAWDWAKAQGWAAGSEQQQQPRSRGGDVWSAWPRGFVEELSLNTERVAGAWALGSVLAIHLRDAAGTGYSSNAAAGLREALARGRDASAGGPWNVHSRVLGNVLYLMASQTTTESTIRQTADLLQQSLS